MDHVTEPGREVKTSGARWIRRSYAVDRDCLRPRLESPWEEYDPLAEAEAPEPARRRGVHLALANLDPRDDRAVQQFASRWGLLGLAYHRLLLVRFEDPDAPPDWRHSLQLVSPGLPFERFAPELFDALFGHRAVRGFAARWDQNSSIEELPATTHFSAYLPDLPGRPGTVTVTSERERLRALFAVLLSDRLWDHLSEPLAEVRQAVERFQELYHYLVDWSSGASPTYLHQRIERDFAVELRQVQQVPVYQPESPRGPESRSTDPAERPSPPGRWVSGWSYPSLLSVAYTLLYRELVSGRYARFCANETCRRAFFGNRPDNIYCTERCRRAQKQRAYRRRASGDGGRSAP
jgi:hypothetical protein